METERPVQIPLQHSEAATFVTSLAGSMVLQYHGRGTFFSSVFTLANSAIGAGVLAFPYAFAQCGLALGIGLCIAFSAVMGYTAHILAVSTAHAQQLSPEGTVRTYQDVARVLVGPRMESAAILTMSVFLFGACIGFLVVIGDMTDPLVSPLFIDSSFASESRRCMIAIVAIIVVMPLCLLPRVSMLGFTSLLSILSVIYIVAIVVIEALLNRDSDDDVRNRIEMVRGLDGTFLAIPLMCLALHCHSFVPIIYSEIESSQRTIPFMNRVIASSIAICTLIYLPVGAFGYYHFGSGTPQDVLTGYVSGSTTIALARIGITCTVTFCFPICHFAVCTAVFQQGSRIGIWGRTRSQMVPHWFQRREAAFFVCCTLMIAMFASHLATIFGLFSSTCGSLIVFMYPALFLSKVPCKGHSWQRHVPVAVLTFLGGLIMIAGTAATLHHMM